MSQENLYKFAWDVGRAGTVEGLFVATPSKVESMIGKEVYFGEILGKHSEVYGTLETKDLQVISSDVEFVKTFKETVKSFGYNPLEYIENEAD